MNNKISIRLSEHGPKVHCENEADQYWHNVRVNFENYLKTQHRQTLTPAGGMEYRTMIRHINSLEYNPQTQTFRTPTATKKFQFSQTPQIIHVVQNN